MRKMTRSAIAGRAWHFCLQALFLFQKLPAIRVTDAAKRQLLSHMSSITSSNLRLAFFGVPLSLTVFRALLSGELGSMTSVVGPLAVS